MRDGELLRALRGILHDLPRIPASGWRSQHGDISALSESGSILSVRVSNGAGT